MANDVSGFGLVVNLICSVSFPAGLLITQFADDADPLDQASIQIADKAMGLNGDMVKWSKANPLPMTLSVIPGSDDDRNLSTLFENNRVGRGKNGARDAITATIIYPDGSSQTLTSGIITDGMAGKAVASAGRLKSRTYQFAFENQVVSIG